MAEIEYLRRRAAEERFAAETSDDPAVAAIHRNLAQLYQGKIDALDKAVRSSEPPPDPA